jgi:hypothetical protein
VDDGEIVFPERAEAFARQTAHLADSRLPTGIDGTAVNRRTEAKETLVTVCQQLTRLNEPRSPGFEELSTTVRAIDPARAEATPELLSAAGVATLLAVERATVDRLGVTPPNVPAALTAALERTAASDVTGSKEQIRTGANAMLSVLPVVVRACRMLRWLHEADVRTYADIPSVRDDIRTAVRTADETPIDDAKTRLRKARAREWTQEDLQTPTPMQFEHLIAALWRRLDETTTVEVTPEHNDGGIDVVAQRRTGGVTVIQAKQHGASNTVGRPTVQQTHGAMSQFAATESVVVTSGSFSESARTAAAAYDDLSLVNGQRLRELLNEPDFASPRAV